MCHVKLSYSLIAGRYLLAVKESEQSFFALLPAGRISQSQLICTYWLISCSDSSVSRVPINIFFLSIYKFKED